MKEKVIIFSAPSGSGKSTIINHLLALHPEFEFSISATTRAPRGQERDGVEYYFKSEAQFDALIADDAFVEYEQVYSGTRYGTLKSELRRIWDKGHVILFDVDVKGGWNLKQYFGDKALSIFVKAPSMEVLRQRLTARGTDSPEAVQERLSKARAEMDFAEGKFDCTLINDRLEDTLVEAERIVSEYLERK
ncbi:MAG: guanylate kinase [Bacteroidales bacterium]|nr:guanylate kinase [Bacteroidales bacterium]